DPGRGSVVVVASCPELGLSQGRNRGPGNRMARNDWPITTLREALEGRNVPELKVLAEGFSTEIPPRKADLVSFILEQMQGDGLQARLRAGVPSPPACQLAAVTAPPQSFVPPPIRYGGNGVNHNGEEEIPVAVRECSAPAAHEVHAVLRLADEGRLSVSDRTR